jgi:hypothetical protein
VNDVDSTQAILDHLDTQAAKPVTFVAYFRPKRRDRTASFVPFFRRHLNSGRVEAVYLAGAGANVVARRLSEHRERVTVVEDNPDRASAIVDQIEQETTGGHIMTVGNAVPPFPRAIQAELDADQPATGVTFQPVVFHPVNNSIPDREVPA